VSSGDPGPLSKGRPMPDTPIPWVGRAALAAIFLLPVVSGHMKLPVGGQLSPG
jgi:hypothetical protein